MGAKWEGVYDHSHVHVCAWLAFMRACICARACMRADLVRAAGAGYEVPDIQRVQNKFTAPPPVARCETLGLRGCAWEGGEGDRWSIHGWLARCSIAR